MKLPTTRNRALLSMLWNRFRLWLRGLKFQERDAASSRSPLRSMWPTMAVPCVLLVQLRQVRSSPAGKARPSGVEPVSTS